MNDTVKYLKLFAIYERRALSILLTEFRKIFKGLNFENMTIDNAELALQGQIKDEQLKKVLFKIHYSIGKEYGNIFARELRKEIPNQAKAWKPLYFFDRAFTQFVNNYYSLNGGLLIRTIKRTIIDTIMAIFLAEHEKPLSPKEIAKEIYKKVNNPNFYKWQALRIARTETGMAMNSSKLIVAEQSGVNLVKKWLHGHNAKRMDRPEHVAIDGETKELNEPFYVMGEYLQVPCDRSRGATGKNVINCKCTVTFVPKRGTNGELIFID